MTKMNKLTKKQMILIYEAFEDLAGQYELYHRPYYAKNILSDFKAFWACSQATYRLDKLIRELSSLKIDLHYDGCVIASSEQYVQNEDIYKAIKEAYNYKVEYDL